MICSMKISSGDVAALLAGKNTKAHQDLLRRFVSGQLPRRNAFHPNVPAQFRTGAILESVYYRTLPIDRYAPQYRVTFSEMDVLCATLDFAEMRGGKLVDFIELKTEKYASFDVAAQMRGNNIGLVKYVRRFFPEAYNQVQHQLLCSGLDSARMVRLRVYSYDDAQNSSRRIRPDDLLEIYIERDAEVIERIVERAQIFQAIKDSYR